MSRWPDDVLERISEACVTTCMTNLALYGLLGLAGPEAEKPGSAEELRQCAHQIVNLGGELTSLGVVLAQQAGNLPGQPNE